MSFGWLSRISRRILPFQVTWSYAYIYHVVRRTCNPFSTRMPLICVIGTVVSITSVGARQVSVGLSRMFGANAADVDDLSRVGRCF